MEQESLLPPIPADAPVPTARSRSTWRSLVIGLVAGAVIGACIGFIAHALNARSLTGLFGGYRAAGGWTVALLALAMWGAILVHEVGHVIGGFAVGFKFMLLVAGPLRLEREPAGNLKLSLNREIASGGGLAGMYPEDQRDLVRRFAWVIAAGPIGSIVGGVILIALAAALPQPSIARSFAATLAGMSLLLALATMTPMTAGVYLTDGARLLQLRRGGPKAERDAAMLSLLASSSTDIPYEAWDRGMVLASIEPVDGSIFELQGRTYAYGWALAKGAIDEARSQLQRALDIAVGLPPQMRGALEMEMAFMAAMYPTAEGSAAPVAWEPQGMPGAVEHGRLRTLAAIAASRGETDSALAHVKDARRLIISGRGAATGGGQWELDRLREIEARVSAAQASRRAPSGTSCH